MRCSSMYCVSRTSAILFNPSTSAVTDYCQSAKDIDTYFKCQLYVGDHDPPAMDRIRTHNFSIDNSFLTTRLHPSLQIWMRLISGNGISMYSQTFWRSFSVITISKSHISMQHCWLATLQVSNCCAKRAWGNHKVTLSVSNEWWSSWQLDDQCIT